MKAFTHEELFFGVVYSIIFGLFTGAIFSILKLLFSAFSSLILMPKRVILVSKKPSLKTAKSISFDTKKVGDFALRKTINDLVSTLIFGTAYLLLCYCFFDGAFRVYSLVLISAFAWLWLVLFETSAARVMRVVFCTLYPVFIFIFGLALYPILTPIRCFSKRVLAPIKTAVISLIRAYISKRIFKIKKSKFIKKTELMLKNI